MPDSPDWSKYLPNSNRYSLQDLGELAARLGSPVTYDRRGEVLFYDDFTRAGKAWLMGSGGAGADVRISGDYSYISPYSMLLLAGSDFVRNATIASSLSPVRLSRIGLEVALSFGEAPSLLIVTMQRYDGSEYHQGSFRINFTDSVIQYLGDDNAYHDLTPTSGMLILAGTFHNFKLVIDLDLDRYVRLLYDEQEFDLSDQALYTAPSVGSEYFYLFLQNTGVAGVNSEAYVGHVILTSNEP